MGSGDRPVHHSFLLHSHRCHTYRILHFPLFLQSGLPRFPFRRRRRHSSPPLPRHSNSGVPLRIHRYSQGFGLLGYTLTNGVRLLPSGSLYYGMPLGYTPKLRISFGDSHCCVSIFYYFITLHCIPISIVLGRQEDLRINIHI